jgi:two-component system alkaline phosphatase synthesis response regulator PhoP
MKKILIVDDEPHIRLLLQQALEEFEDHGVQILTVDNGIDALETIRERRPDIVYLDVMMPGMNGFDVCRKVKEDPGLTGVHIVILTAKGQEVDKQKGQDVGADLYMTKPFNPDDLVSRTATVLGIEL